MVGHSTGGTVTLLAACAPEMHDPRLRAGADLSGDSCFFVDTFFATRATPFLAVAGSDDLLVPPANNPVRAFASLRGRSSCIRLRWIIVVLISPPRWCCRLRLSVLSRDSGLRPARTALHPPSAAHGGHLQPQST